MKVTSRAKLGHFNFRAETELTILTLSLFTFDLAVWQFTNHWLLYIWNFILLYAYVGTVSFLESVHFFGGFWAHFPGVAVSKFKSASEAPILSPFLLPLWAPLIDAAHLLNPLLLPLWAPLIDAAHLLSPLSATPLSSFNWCCSPFESLSATPLSSFNWCCSPFESPFCYPFEFSLLLPLWAFPPATPLGFLFF